MLNYFQRQQLHTYNERHRIERRNKHTRRWWPYVAVALVFAMWLAHQ